MEFEKYFNLGALGEDTLAKWCREIGVVITSSAFVFVFVITPDGTGTLTEERRMYVDLWHGKCRGAYYVTPDNPAPENVAYIFGGKYGDWLKVFDGKLDPLKGVLQRKFKVKCSPKDMAKMLRAVKASQELVKCTQIEGVEYP